jgi:aminoglycoside phosphotransferase family enzyme/predicted kinase
VIDYAVKMLRLPEERMMCRLLDQGGVTEADIKGVAGLVASFHAAAARSREIDRFGSLAMLRANREENLRQVRPFINRTIPEELFAQIETGMAQQLTEKAALIAARIEGGFIRECDGDLHSENICLDSRVHIFDCIEFNEKFRCSDTAADVAFLVMDLENHHRRDLAELFLAEYISASGDSQLPEVLPLYLPVRAFIRGKVESFRLDDTTMTAADKLAAAGRAERFFRLAHGYCVRGKLPSSLIITCAPTGSGKSVLAAELCFRLGIEQFSSDLERKKLAGILPTERGINIYSREWHQRTYGRLKALAAAELAAKRSVVVDGTFCRKEDRAGFAELAASHGSRFVILRLGCPDEVIQQRLKARQQEPAAVSDGTWEVYQQQAATMVEPTAAEGDLLQLNGTLPATELVDTVMTQLGADSRR